MPFSDIFKSKLELEAEAKKQQKKELRNATRSCDRVRSDLERQEQQLELDIKAAAAKNDKDLAKVLAKQLIKVRGQKVRADGTKSKISSISNHASTIQTNTKLAQIMANSAAVMSKVSQQMQPEQLANHIVQFQAETSKMDMKDDMMNEMFDEIFEEDDSEADTIMSQVLEEIGLEIGESLTGLSATSKDALATKQAAKEGPVGKQGIKNPENH